ncbi:MAG: hypothetical protein NTW19_08210 [Planctomycetota bacterium]|nr:hypothetical protein [Planctomycetota bacterium]
MTYDIGTAIKRKGKPSIKQAIQADKIMAEAIRVGFKPPSDGASEAG